MSCLLKNFQQAILHTANIASYLAISTLSIYLKHSRSLKVAVQRLVLWPTLIHLSIYLSIYLSMTLQTFVRPWLLYLVLDFFTQSIGLLGRGISPLQGRYLHTGQHKHRINAHRYPCLEWDSNSRSQCLSERRQFMARPL
jgi:hypothetical protein